VNCGTAQISWQIGVGTGPLPAGLTLDSTTGVISGIPTTVQFASIRLGAFVNNQAIAFGSYSFNVYKPLVFLTTSPLSPATSGVAVTRSIQVSVAAVWDSSQVNLPTGVRLTFPPSGGDTTTLSGTFPAVTTATTYSFKLFASGIANTQESISQVFSIVVNPPPTISGTFTTGEVTVPYNSSLTAAGGTAPYAYSIGERNTASRTYLQCVNRRCDWNADSTWQL